LRGGCEDENAKQGKEAKKINHPEHGIDYAASREGCRVSRWGEVSRCGSGCSGPDFMGLSIHWSLHS
jgi:hypothetical protein